LLFVVLIAATSASGPNIVRLLRLRYYGQNGEDAVLWRFFNSPRGFYVDVGAFDGVYLSNSKIFEDAGWDGICVEALPQYADLCRDNRPRATVIAAAVVAGDRDTVELTADPTGLFTGQTSDTLTVAGHYKGWGFQEPEWETVRVPAVTLNEVMDRKPRIDFLSLDIEGGEIDVLSTVDFERHRPRVLLLEANTEVERIALEETLAPVGYLLARSLNWNHFFAAADDVERLRRAHALVWLQRPPHPVRPELTALGYAGRRLRLV
jgi:FkbM family methyltransferase